MKGRAIDNYFLNVAECGKSVKMWQKWKKCGKNMENILT